MNIEYIFKNIHYKLLDEWEMDNDMGFFVYFIFVSCIKIFLLRLICGVSTPWEMFYLFADVLILARIMLILAKNNIALITFI